MPRKAPSDPSAISIADYTYELPDQRIAKYPLSERDTSKLLVYRDGGIAESVFKDLPELLEPNDCLVFNDTRVIHARLHFQRPTGAHIEVLCLEPLEPAEVTEAFAQTEFTTWRAMVRNGKRWKPGEFLVREIETEERNYRLFVELIGKEHDSSIVRFFWDSGEPLDEEEGSVVFPDRVGEPSSEVSTSAEKASSSTSHITFAEVLDDVGILPLPPYLNRETEAEDEERYQTMYAQADGSVAAPTAGLHFTQPVFDSLKELNVQSLFVTLHVGAGTFKPVKSATMKDHDMHSERIVVSRNALERMHAAAQKQRIIPVGTTSLRTIESIYWFGIKLLAGHEMKELNVSQWEPYQLADRVVKASEALQAVLGWMEAKELNYLTGQTQLLIAPGYTIRMANALITNFHQPNSTLLLLVAAFIGEDWRKVYEYALNKDFRFLSFGDSSILFAPHQST